MVKKHKNVIGVWRLGKTLGAGSSSCVRLAKHTETGQLAAMKIIPRAAAFVGSEILLMRLLQHPNIMQLYDVWTDSTNLYLALEYVQGGQLYDYVCKNGPLDEQTAVNFFGQILNALSYCHRLRVCHRDLKLENILIDPTRGTVKIADFGMARVQPESVMLQTGCGSLHYVPPEIIKKQQYRGKPADVWSCGVILYALLSSSLPFDDTSVAGVFHRIIMGRYVLPAHLSPYAKDLLKRMLTVDPLERITIPEIWQHPFMKQCSNVRVDDGSSIDQTLPLPSRTPVSLNENILECLQILCKDLRVTELRERVLNDLSSTELRIYHGLERLLGGRNANMNNSQGLKQLDFCEFIRVHNQVLSRSRSSATAEHRPCFRESFPILRAGAVDDAGCEKVVRFDKPPKPLLVDERPTDEDVHFDPYSSGEFTRTPDSSATPKYGYERVFPRLTMWSSDRLCSPSNDSVSSYEASNGYSNGERRVNGSSATMAASMRPASMAQLEMERTRQTTDTHLRSASVPLFDMDLLSNGKGPYPLNSPVGRRSSQSDVGFLEPELLFPPDNRNRSMFSKFLHLPFFGRSRKKRLPSVLVCCRCSRGKLEETLIDVLQKWALYQTGCVKFTCLSEGFSLHTFDHRGLKPYSVRLFIKLLNAMDCTQVQFDYVDGSLEAFSNVVFAFRLALKHKNVLCAG
ncbi:CAMK/CAMKL/GIN4 protein kinase Cdr1 [Schizosaccharomyces japonicus yFS275]|uniref:CAMK/CAMKL/GIN4 protein kinase Cdr1 n=1 Tax=Schizosaccharomyces japonicus (strain yFS275 / FY16936) TaxID=402676 RepID=B6K6Y5_SCHJY|nr:CAMK/CAMKL/GIN4 protein kinase Cdr1 [Schizosaccharomyces japonicus yFS275]EEB09289.1 CAMK/CAMKL/GIN4 protein kinase Cdr1 [Schizosaccharomyces japonicus yFS275]